MPLTGREQDKSALVLVNSQLKFAHHDSHKSNQEFTHVFKPYTCCPELQDLGQFGQAMLRMIGAKMSSHGF
jgi:hypothetical protein